MTDEASHDDLPSSPLLRQAAGWISDLSSDPSEQNIAGLKAWYAASPENRKAFASVMFSADVPNAIRAMSEAALGRKFDILADLPGVSPEMSQDREGQAQGAPWGPRRPGTAEPSRRVGNGGRKTWFATAAAAAIAAAAIGLTSNPISDLVASPATAESFRTGHAEIRSYSLSDGTDITLDSDSRVEITIDRTRRHARLHKGRARFIVKADPRPFAIEAGGKEVVSKAGTVDVELDAARRADVRLRAGSADLRTDAGTTKALVINQPIVYSPENVTPTVLAAPPADTRDWPAGWVEYRTVALGTLIEQANRYAKSPIILDDPGLSNLQATGRFRLLDTEAFAKHITEPFGLRVSRRSDGIHLSR
ncbi:FecR family protein [Sphingomonas lycopersici]|uniref:FecR domain-containing protein n=1 Tax=Sphingomonas lycopersici TaxID=2951807 RepID=A0AA41ZIG5_9SPHN|nr:FecR domain-containing protein [Sphingomonas lycopersici]MCW6536278.1 FecR domain-containing protein [Sphingomonas lycopersici]